MLRLLTPVIVKLYIFAAAEQGDMNSDRRKVHRKSAGFIIG